jgi:hypothetical protein
MVRRSKDDIFYFCEHVIRFTPAGKQVDFLQTIQDLTLNPNQTPKQIGVKAGTGVGKTASLSAGGMWRWWRSPGSLHVNTAPTERQCREVFFAEISNHVARSPILGNMVNLGGAKLTMKDHPHWKIFAATASDENAIRGLHHPDMTIMAEELTGIREDIIAALLRTCSQKNNLFISIFNPDRTSGTAYEMFHSRKDYWPWNLTIDKLSLSRERPDLVDPERIEQVRKEFGEDSDMWLVGVMGEFPQEGSKTVLPLRFIEESVGNPMGLAIALGPGLRVISVDFARFGGDENVIYVRSGNAIIHWEATICDPNVAAARSRELALEMGWDPSTVVFVIDSVGMGQALAYDYLEMGLNLCEFHPARKSPVEGYRNHLSAAWFNLRHRMKHSTVHIPDDPVLHQQLVTREFTYVQDRIEVESKKKYRDRGFKKSPDRADALIMAFSEEGDILGSQSLDMGAFFGSDEPSEHTDIFKQTW